MFFLHCFLCFFLIYCSFFVGHALYPVESVLYLILAFCNAAGILFLFNSEFLGLIFIIIYVGAIAVLFLFVIMMLSNKTNNSAHSNTVAPINIIFYTSFLIFWFLLFLIEAVNTFNADIFSKKAELINNFFFLFDNLNNIDILGQVLFNYFSVCFLLAGLILLVALVGSIVLTLKFNNFQQGQLISRQLSRTDKFISIFSFNKDNK